MSDRLTEALRSEWTARSHDAAGADLLAGLDARLEAAVAARTRRRRVTAVGVVVLAAALLLTVGDGTGDVDAPRIAGDAPAAGALRGRPELPTLPRLPTGARRLSTAQAPATPGAMPTLPRRPTVPAPGRNTARPAGEGATEARS